MINPTPVPSNVPRQAQLPSSGPPPLALPVPSNGTGSVRIKAEPGSPYDSQPASQINGIPHFGSSVAQHRAAQNLLQKFGSNANQQINQLQAQTAIAGPGPQQPQNLQNIQLPPKMTEQPRRDVVNEQKRQMQNRQYQPLPQAQRPSINNSQTDGADDWNAMVTQRRAEAFRNPSANNDADATIREQVIKMSRALEGGGLMVPFSELPKPSQTKRTVVREVADIKSSPLPAATKIAQFDGLDDFDNDNVKYDPDLEDEDAINSGLDDPDDNVVDEGDEDAQQGQIMLCTYDKVQRVKNKWKCTLKDGVLTTGGRE